jgi:hypothetical protein
MVRPSRAQWPLRMKAETTHEGEVVEAEENGYSRVSDSDLGS